MNTGLLLECETEEFDAVFLFRVDATIREWDPMYSFVYMNLRAVMLYECTGACAGAVAFMGQLETVLNTCSPSYNNQFKTGLTLCDIAYVTEGWVHAYCFLGN